MGSDKPKRPRATGRLDAEKHDTLIIPALSAFDTRFAAAEVIYHPVPPGYQAVHDATVWRVLLKFGATGQRIIAGLDIYGDVVFGRGAGEPDSPDVDLTNLGALERGVSRRHAMLRPTANKLYVIDLNSTNGTYVNAVPVSRGMAQTIRSHDALALGGLNCVVEIVSSPASREGAPIIDSAGAAEPVDISPTLRLGKPASGRETIPGFRLAEVLKTPPEGPPPATKPTEAKPEEKKKG